MLERERLYFKQTDLTIPDNRRRLIAEGILPPLPDSDRNYFRDALKTQGLQHVGTIKADQLFAVPGHQAGSMKGGLSAHLLIEQRIIVITSKNPSHLTDIPDEVMGMDTLRSIMERAVSGPSKVSTADVDIYEGEGVLGFHFPRHHLALVTDSNGGISVITEEQSRGHAAAKIVTLHSQDNRSEEISAS